jgi:Ran GTPase-activating protein (RanGAP) involved in mRNA processing and transport
LKLQDNDIGVKGAEVISQSLKQNKTLRGFKLAENDIQSEGAEFILKSNFSLEWIDIGKNKIGNRVGPTLQYFIESSANLKKLNLEYNELQLKGVEYITAGNLFLAI